MLYGGKYGALDETELEQPIEKFRSINELFTHGVRSEPERVNQFLAPVDGTVQDIGCLKNETVMTIKGIGYKLNSLCPEIDTAAFREGNFAILSLSPRGGHRVFSPARGLLQQLVHIPGNRLLAYPTYQTPKFPVFSLNERLVMQLDTSLGKCLLIMVAGWGVGHITHPFRLNPRISPRRVSITKLDPPRSVDLAEWIATFELGSTFILITEQKRVSKTLIERDQQIRLGQPLFDTVSTSNSGDSPHHNIAE